MSVNIILFGQLADITGSKNIVLENVSDTNEAIHQLHHLYPRLANAPYRIAVEKEIITANTPLRHNDTLALLPPYAGG